MQKIIDKLEGSKDVLYSFEVFPPRSPEGTQALLGRLDSLALHEPLFVDVTWAGGIECLQAVLTVASHAQKVWEGSIVLGCVSVTVIEPGTQPLNPPPGPSFRGCPCSCSFQASQQWYIYHGRECPKRRCSRR